MCRALLAGEFRDDPPGGGGVLREVDVGAAGPGVLDELGEVPVEIREDVVPELGGPVPKFLPVGSFGHGFAAVGQRGVRRPKDVAGKHGIPDRTADPVA